MNKLIEKCNELVAAIHELEDKLRNAQKQVAEHEATLDLRFNADSRAIARWNRAHPDKPLTQPDHVDLCIWLMETNDELRAEVAALKAGESRSSASW